MSYFAAFVDSTGIHIPSYTDIRDYMVERAKSIYGNDIYLGNDSADYQLFSMFANIANDCNQSAVLSYNNRSPLGAVGQALDSIAKVNGIRRSPSTYSTVSVVITGTPSTVINGGIVQDVSGNRWNLPSTVTIGIGGTIEVIATSEVSGSIVANVGDVNIIVTIIAGWSSVTNNQAATIGTPVESDSMFRARQATSTAQPSQTVLEGLRGSIATVSGVTRHRVYENDTSTIDPEGLPPHSVTCVVEGGNNEDIATSIINKKTLGTYTNGDVTVNIADSQGQTNTIRFFRPTYVDIDVVINVKALSGYTTAITESIKVNVSNYLSSLAIGDDLAISSLWGAALSVMPNLSQPNFSITAMTASRHGNTPTTNDIVINFSEVTRGNINYININVI